jgi:hypothetical protein
MVMTMTWMSMIDEFVLNIERAISFARVLHRRAALDSQTDSVKKNRICLYVVNPSAVCWLGTALDGQTDSIKKNGILLSVVNPFFVLARNGARRPDRFSEISTPHFCLIFSLPPQKSATWNNYVPPYRE